MTSEPQTRSKEIRESLGYPVIDCDGHMADLLPVLVEFLREVGGSALVDRLVEQRSYQTVVGKETLATTLAERRYDWRVYDAWWALSPRTLDRATAMLPRLLEDRMGEMGVDYTVLFPSETGIVQVLSDDELRRAGCRAHNLMVAELFRPHRRVMTPVACIPMFTPDEAIEELEFAVGVLGLKAVNLGGTPHRPIRRFEDELPDVAPYVTRQEVFGIDSDYDYDPVWAKCAELGVAACFHGKQRPTSISSYVYNHVGAFAAGSAPICKALFLGGVTRRHPELNFGFLEGGVAWASMMFADLLSHWDKRNGEAIHELDPDRIDVDEMLVLIDRYGELRHRSAKDAIEAHLRFTGPRPEYIDEFAACGIRRREDIYELFVPRFFFGCEADSPHNALAFDQRINPFGGRLQAVLGSDIGHWDVPDVRQVVEEAYELVEHGLMSEDDFRAFTFENAVRFHGGMNPAFFEDTPIERAAADLLSASPT